MARYSCSLSGTCEVTENGKYSSPEECLKTCLGSTEKELDYLALEYALDSDVDVGSIAPSDRVELIRRRTRVTVSEEDSFYVLKAIAGAYVLGIEYEGILSTLVMYPGLWDLGWDIDNGGAFKERLLGLGVASVLEWLKSKGYEMKKEDWIVFLGSNDADPEVTRMVTDSLVASFSDIYAYGIEAGPLFSALKDSQHRWYYEALAMYQRWVRRKGLTPR